MTSDPIADMLTRVLAAIPGPPPEGGRAGLQAESINRAF